MPKKILVIDDEPEMVELIRKYLKREGFQVITGNTGREAVQLAKREKPDLIILDIIMPEMDGLEACQVLRRDSLTPIILISAKGDDTDKVLGLGLGADDYLTKPFSLKELVARIKAHLRRCDFHKEAAPETGSGFIACGPLEIDTRSHEVHLGGKQVVLTSREFELLSFMVQNANQVFNRETLYEKIWGYDSSGDSRTVMVHIRRLREKIEENPNKPRYLKTIWGIGYKFCAH